MTEQMPWDRFLTTISFPMLKERGYKLRKLLLSSVLWTLLEFDFEILANALLQHYAALLSTNLLGKNKISFFFIITRWKRY